ncbi:septal ring lytic transglycosylase RlpA family protein [Planosporangium flavigriseum]|uniref:Probable endolytic peptidoglycan transglycosylase RlpA n=1 Tax=Planosporangium flavigriseum TaxID=373681 RepID=A0A8J3PJS4_9ACTN|nr:septal ring lytic transglycosylase RlpA family protein [Planosporangium flavigriseum]GIG72122.1 hypothetical protein Pfl04_05260 [Planosporangium flavigriseum]
MVTGTSVAALGWGPSARDTRADAAQLVSADRTQQRADRSVQRLASPEAIPSTTPSATPSATPTAVPSSASPSVTVPAPTPSKAASKAAPKPPSGGGAVVGTGSCQASFYTDEGGRTANGETFHTADFTAAHKTLAFNTKVRVTNVSNGKSVVVRINDRGPFVSGRCLDLSPAAFNTISSTSAGVATVKYEVLQG